MQMQTILKRNPEPLAVDMDGETVMMDMESGNYFGINSVGSYIWNLLENECTLQSIIDSVQQHFEISNDDTVEADITAFLSDMLEQNLIETADES